MDNITYGVEQTAMIDIVIVKWFREPGQPWKVSNSCPQDTVFGLGLAWEYESSNWANMHEY